MLSDGQSKSHVGRRLPSGRARSFCWFDVLGHAKILAMLQSIQVLVGTAGVCCAGGGLFFWAAVAPSAQLFGPTLRKTGDFSTIALTFDDGPNPVATPAILDLLEKYESSASFFQIGERVRAFPELAEEVLRRGHTIGNHTDTHRRLTFLSKETIARELNGCAAALERATGRRTSWVRPPFGYRGPQLAGALRLQNCVSGVVMWSASARDWRAQSSEQVINRLRQVKGGDIVLLHDGDHRVEKGDRRHTIAALQYWVPRWKDSGLRLVNLDNLTRADI